MKKNVLDEKCMLFAVRIVKFYQYLCTDKKEYVLSKQILRSGTSIGANVRESRNAQSKADFANKLNIALKEADETQYWFELLKMSDMITEDHFNSLNQDLSEIIALLITSIKTVKAKIS